MSSFHSHKENTRLKHICHYSKSPSWTMKKLQNCNFWHYKSTIRMALCRQFFWWGRCNPTWDTAPNIQYRHRPKFNIAPWTNDDWKTTYFPFRMVYFQGPTVKLPGGTAIKHGFPRSESPFPRVGPFISGEPASCHLMGKQPHWLLHVMQQHGPPKKGGSFLLGRDVAANIDCGWCTAKESRIYKVFNHIVRSIYVYKGCCIYVTSTII